MSAPKPKRQKTAKTATSRRRSKPSKRPKSDPALSGPERLQKVLAAAGVGSRRQCEELILEGRVDVDREVVTELGTKVDPTSQQIRVDGLALKRPKMVYYAVNKPPGMVCTNRDPSGRARVIDLVPNAEQRLFTVGRLDLNSEGLIILTNDGELANRLTHPRYQVRKTYRVLVAGHPDRDITARLRRGVHLDDGLAKVTGVQIKRKHKQSTILEMVLDEGRNREIRRVLAKVGHKVLLLVRIAVGPVKLGNLAPGKFRQLTAKEVASLKQATHGGKP